MKTSSLLLMTTTARLVFLLRHGSAKFASGQFKIYDSGAVDIYRKETTLHLVSFKLKSNVGANDTTVVNILTDGSASFAGEVSVPKVFVDTDVDNDSALLLTSGYNASGTTSVWTDYRTRRGGTWDTWSVGSRGASFRFNVALGSTTGPGLENYVFDIDNNGAATFAGAIASAGLSSSDQVSVDRPASSTTSGFRVFGGGAIKSTLFTDGSASFVGDIDANNVTFNLEPDNPDNYTTTTEEYEETIKVPIVGGVGTADLVDGEPERFEEKTVTRTREVTTYTGPTLDVKEKLLEYEERFKQQDALIAQMTAGTQKTWVLI